MLLIIGALVLLAAALVIIFSARARGGANSSSLGQMSEQWLAENRASHERQSLTRALDERALQARNDHPRKGPMSLEKARPANKAGFKK